MSGDQVLSTTLVGPPAKGLRGALDALAFYAARPEARPRPDRIDRALWAAGTTVHAARLVVSDRALFRAALWPTGLTVAGCAIFAGLATATADAGDQHPGTTFNAFLVSFVALASMPPTLLQRLWIRVANEARRAHGLPPGEDPFPGESLPRLLWREGRKAVRQALVVSIGLAPLLGVAHLLPFGSHDAALLAGAWGFYWLVVDAFEIPMEVIPGPRHHAADPWYGRLLVRLGEVSRWLRPSRWFGRALSRLTAPWNGEVRFTERHAWETAGFGLVIGTVLAVPVAGLFFRAVAITAATSLLGRLGEPIDAPRAADLPPPLEPPRPPP
jgi:hypothetical protein